MDHSIRDKTHVDYSSKDGNTRYIKRAVQHLIADKVASTMADVAAKKRKRVHIDAKHSQEPQLNKAFVDTGGIDVNALMDGCGIVLD